jgi:two-component sensor histidine kinase
MGEPGIDLTCYTESTMLPLDNVTALGMAVAELVTNGYRHAFPDDREGAIIVTLARADAGNAILMIQDDGVDFDTTASTSRRGLGLVRQLVDQISESVSVRNRIGTLWMLTFQSQTQPIARKKATWSPVMAKLWS